MKISIVTPVLNGKRFIRQTIESVLSQKGDFAIEYIIKDGGSTDGTIELLQTYETRADVKIMIQPDRSLYDAINQGFQSATGDIGGWINADDYYEPGALQIIADAFKTHPSCQWMYGHCKIVNENGREIRKLITRYKAYVGRRFSRHRLLYENFINQPSCFWRMPFWRCIGGLDTNYKYAADYDLWLKMADRFHDPVYIQRTLAYFRRCGTSLSDQNFVQQFQEELLIAKPYSGPLTRCMHIFNVYRTILVYRLLQRLDV